MDFRPLARAGMLEKLSIKGPSPLVHKSNILQPNSCYDGGNYSCRLKTYIILLHAVKVTSESQVAIRGTAVWLGLAFQS